ncbi:hypothetical protein NQ166_03635 [Microbacterium sp. zg.Y1090]|uniref:hypothetical protein n=1 Tax=Microbacterium TaxID=33882 RepID=UPI00214AB226|nr:MULTISPECIES: hypothetical protein [unclassified Microbacterium]MCR2814075.1 hypothetical protein [Microbacterium sp. zg.Y1084]MCR2817920.1 hypothetical protein [Microbacterium sp. zg.Y1090]MDL5487774.1 hypothetical protein [Microbacterium sp. zg-Y1211]WIM27915.1 hypothetical protein QNO26_12280 [Microbacterium sp. zg-Y1090]
MSLSIPDGEGLTDPHTGLPIPFIDDDRPVDPETGLPVPVPDEERPVPLDDDGETIAGADD